MALPYPEGEVFFKRSVLKDNGNGLDPDNLTSFNGHALIEWCWNQSSGSSYSRSHSLYQPGVFEKDKRYYYNDALVVQFGTEEGFENKVGSGDGDTRHDSRHSGIKRLVKTSLPASGEYERRQRGGTLMTALTPIKLEPDEPYMYIDLTFPIRAIYFPLAQKPSKVFPDLCSYLMVDFRLRQGVEMWDTPVLLPPREERVLLPNEQKMKSAMEEKIQEALRAGKKSEAASIRKKLDRILDYNTWVPMEFDSQAGLGIKSNREPNPSYFEFPSTRDTSRVNGTAADLSENSDA